MAYSDFQDFLSKLESAGELKKIREPISPYLEITEVADRVMKSGGPALLFEDVRGLGHRLGTPDPMSAVMGHASIHPMAVPTTGAKYDFPVAINTMGSRKRMSMALSCEDFEEHADRLRELLKPEIPKGFGAALKKLPHLLSELKPVVPKTGSKGLGQQIVLKGDDIDLTKLPVLTCWPEDAGPFITLPLVFTHDPNTGKRNVGMYRMQVYSKNTCALAATLRTLLAPFLLCLPALTK
jgi:4-hydroxy-3-polyprenylbenzoate decarboxylase